MTNSVGVSIFLPHADYVGKTLGLGDASVTLPEPPTQDGEHVFDGAASTVHIPLAEGQLVVGGVGALVVQDNRPYGENAYEVRLLLKPGAGDIEQARLELSFSRAEK